MFTAAMLAGLLFVASDLPAEMEVTCIWTEYDVTMLESLVNSFEADLSAAANDQSSESIRLQFLSDVREKGKTLEQHEISSYVRMGTTTKSRAKTGSTEIRLKLKADSLKGNEVAFGVAPEIIQITDDGTCQKHTDISFVARQNERKSIDFLLGVLMTEKPENGIQTRTRRAIIVTVQIIPVDRGHEGPIASQTCP